MGMDEMTTMIRNRLVNELGNSLHVHSPNGVQVRWGAIEQQIAIRSDTNQEQTGSVEFFEMVDELEAKGLIKETESYEDFDGVFVDEYEVVGF